MLPTVNNRPHRGNGPLAPTSRGFPGDCRLRGVAAGPSAERTSPREGSGIRSHPPRRSGALPTARTMNTQPNHNWTQHTHFAARRAGFSLPDADVRVRTVREDVRLATCRGAASHLIPRAIAPRAEAGGASCQRDLIAATILVRSQRQAPARPATPQPSARLTDQREFLPAQPAFQVVPGAHTHIVTTPANLAGGFAG